MMERLFFLILVLFVLPVGIVADEKIIELNVTGQAPLNTDEQNGFIDVVAKEAFRRIGYELRMVRLPAERGLKNSNQGLIDGELVRVAGMQKLYPNLMIVPEKVMDWEFSGFSYQLLNFEHGWSDLSGKSVAYVNGWKIFEKNVPGTAEITRTSSAEILFQLLRKKRTDIVLYERWGGHYLLHKMNMDDVEVCKQPLAVKAMYIYLHKKHRSLVPKLSSALVAMKEDGSYQKLFNQYLMPFNEHSTKSHDGHIKN